MYRKCLFVVALVLNALAVSADDDSWMEMAPDHYIAKNTQIIISRESPCNQGEEAFMDFIPKFRADKAFRQSRLHFEGEDAELMSNCFRMQGEFESGYRILKAVNRNSRCDKSFGTWYNVSADEVCFRYDDVLLCVDAGGGSVSARFQRINGKWYCTGFFSAG